VDKRRRVVVGHRSGGRNKEGARVRIKVRVRLELGSAVNEKERRGER
jgi:hypothetical protein